MRRALPRSLQILLLAAGAAAFAAALYGLALDRLTGEDAAAAAFREQAEFSAGRQARVASAEEVAAATGALRAELDRYALRGDDVVEFIETIEGLATTTGTTAAVVAVVGGKAPEPLTLTVEGQGSWRALMRLLMLLETLPYPTRITAVSFREVPSEGAARWQETVTLEVYQVLDL